MKPTPVVDIAPETVEHPQLITAKGGEWVALFINVENPVANWTVTNRSNKDVYLAYTDKQQVFPGQIPPKSILLDPFGEESRDEDTRQLFVWLPTAGQTAEIQVIIQYRYNKELSGTGQRVY